MKYYEVEMTITPCTQDAQDILSAMAAEAGFETFEETPTGLLGYVRSGGPRLERAMGTGGI